MTAGLLSIRGRRERKEKARNIANFSGEVSELKAWALDQQKGNKQLQSKGIGEVVSTHRISIYQAFLVQRICILGLIFYFTTLEVVILRR